MQLSQVLNSQSDAIVVVRATNKTPLDQYSVPETQEQSVLFCNSKSVELFGYDLSLSKSIPGDRHENRLNEPSFVLL